LISQHYIGNRATELAHGEPDLQIVYSTGITVLSFFIPIMVLAIAFVAVGTQNSVSWWRITIGGTLAGSAICGMHYLGNASIYNYKCVYDIINVVGAAVIALVASTTALSMFFVFRASWANAWWKRLASAVVLAGAVSGMHWCAATGTHYQLVRRHPGETGLSRNSIVIIVICMVRRRQAQRMARMPRRVFADRGLSRSRPASSWQDWQCIQPECGRGTQAKLRKSS
jgi:NO-binding membrane sensor protein with MHYT domain